ncbi:hypothetical protein PoB_003320100 [Plakobranchus ocellatus]|uniref:Uncharacterized protein n=1 Tax=Plakobranchus ocellatus TaxID=259542 RepID=A0AAV4AEH2_9GAST|nr:hypothetical protein PoB_003320100 [Plakobranchus ocellatus]
MQRMPPLEGIQCQLVHQGHREGHDEESTEGETPGQESNRMNIEYWHPAYQEICYWLHKADSESTAKGARRNGHRRHV